MSYEIGIDVSKYQGEVDWAKVKASGQSFVFVRWGTSTGTAASPLTPILSGT